MKAAAFLKKLYKVPGIKNHFDEVNVAPVRSGREERQDADQGSALGDEEEPATGKAGLFVGELGWALGRAEAKR